MYVNVIDDLEKLFKCTNKVSDIIAVSKTRLTKQSNLSYY